MSIEELKAEIVRLEHQVNYWRIEAETDNARWLRCLADVERLRKAGESIISILCQYVEDSNLRNLALREWSAAKEGKPSV